MIERALGAELTEHLGYEKGDPTGRGKGNSRNGTSSKTLLTEDGEVEIAVPRGLDKALFTKLVAGDWIARHQCLLSGNDH